MVIKKLILKNFGKFQNKTIELSDGMNLVYGNNEAGKTTIHRFIEGMFYGFYKANMKNKKYTQEYEQYLPWNQTGQYSGVILLEDQGKEIRLERNFLKNHDLVEAFNSETGDNISHEYEYDPVTKLIQPGLQHFGLSQTAYSNTIHITQMGNKTDEELVAEIKDNMINLGETNSIDVSVNEVMKKLQAKKAEIGTLRSKKSALYKTHKTIIALRSEKEKSKEDWNEIELLREKEEELIKELQTIEENKKLLSEQLKLLKYQKDKNIFEKSCQIQNEVKELETKIKEREIYEKLSKSDIDFILTRKRDLENLKKENIQKEERLKDFEDRIIELQSNLDEVALTREQVIDSGDISRDLYQFEELKTEKEKIGQLLNQDQLKAIEDDYRQTHRRKQRAQKISAISVIGVALFALLSFFGSNNPLFLILVLAWLACVIGSIVLVSMQYKKEQALLVKIKELKRKKQEQTNVMEKLNASLKEILVRYNLEDFEALRKCRDDQVKKEVLYQENCKKRKQLEDKMIELNKQHQKNKDEYKNSMERQRSYEQEIKDFMEYYSIQNDKELLELQDGHYEYLGLVQEKNNKLHLTEQMTRDLSFDPSKQMEPDVIIKPEKSYEEIEIDQKQCNESIVTLSKEISSLHSKIITKESKIRQVSDIEAELNKKQSEYDYMQFKLQSFKLIEEAIDHISNSIQNNFAPQLNQAISNIISEVTSGKYSDIMVNPEMEIMINDQEINKLVKAEDLSAGTLDLMYFALRLGIASLITRDKKVPIILDDCFVQYDKDRLKRTLEVLKKIKCQIIFFTCHERERTWVKEILGDMNEVVLD